MTADPLAGIEIKVQIFPCLGTSQFIGIPRKSVCRVVLSPEDFCTSFISVKTSVGLSLALFCASRYTGTAPRPRGVGDGGGSGVRVPQA